MNREAVGAGDARVHDLQRPDGGRRRAPDRSGRLRVHDRPPRAGAAQGKPPGAQAARDPALLVDLILDTVG